MTHRLEGQARAAGEDVAALVRWLNKRALIARLLDQRAAEHATGAAWDLVEATLERARAHAHEAGDRTALMSAVRHLIAVAARRGRWATADELSRELVRLARVSGSDLALGIALRVRGELLSDPSFVPPEVDVDPRALAAAAFEAALAALERASDAVERGLALRAYAGCLIASGDRQRGMELVHRAKHLMAH